MLQTAFAHQITFDDVQCHAPANQRGHHRGASRLQFFSRRSRLP
jgi:hypothetical protein